MIRVIVDAVWGNTVCELIACCITTEDLFCKFEDGHSEWVNANFIVAFI